ncbi:hypothetical protein [Curtobacterium sp. VKM Ac-1376]|uniref:hypothetical protein n=1 Tax=Curtobacterium sp. VKM Ac-1376 TaxID=123312 RepID=UPI00188A4231|nr:hypothetical protein [Curtobacterium sp. VKM Ac-1376]MBF4614137.1 hypothetical protein [Curtobacterium sp. VKM Ac-1376]
MHADIAPGSSDVAQPPERERAFSGQREAAWPTKLDGGWPWSRTYDGVHPTVPMSKKASVRMQQAIHIAAEGAKG